MNTKNRISEIKAFKRILKEIGIYKLYIVERKRQKPRFPVFGYYDGFSNIIDSSLRWSVTECPAMWHELFCTTRYGDYDKCSSICENNELLTSLKAIVQRYT